MLANPHEERLLVCVDYGSTGRKLIQRGGHLARLFGAELIILVFDSLPDEEFAYHKEVDIPLFKQLAAEYDAKVIVKKARAIDITEKIVKTAEKENISQVIIGQVVESVWTTLLGRSIVDVLLKQLPNADLHVVPVERASEEEDFDYDAGNRAYLIKQSDGTYEMTFYDPNQRAVYEGIFFKSLYTDFDNGIFAFRNEDDKIMEVAVKENIVSSLIDIDDY